MLEKTFVVSRIEVLENGVIHLREDQIISEDGKEIIRLPHRRVLEPTLSHNETNPRIVDILNVVWTANVVDDYLRKKEERERDGL